MKKDKMKRLTILVIVIVGIRFPFPNRASGQAPNYGQIRGKVVNTDTEEALPGVNIIITGTLLGTTSDIQGNFYLYKIPTGLYSFKATMMGFKSQTIEAEIKPGETTILNFRLKETVIETPALVVTASKRRQSLQESPNSLAVVTARDIERINEVSLDKVLQYAPGVNFTVSNINIRGSSGFSRGAGSRVLFLVDGIPMMPGDSGDIKWDILPVTQIHQIEIVKGAGSALYGSYALGGMVNVVTKEPSEKPETSFRLSAGFYDKPYYPEWRWTNRLLHFDQVDLSHSRSWKKLNLLLAVGRRQTTGFNQNGHYQRWNLLGKLRYNFSPQTYLTFNSSYSTDDRGEVIMWRNQHDALEVPWDAQGNEVHSYKFNWNGILKKVINRKFACKFQTSYFRNRWQNFFRDNNDFSRAENIRSEFQADILPSAKHAIITGIEAIYDKVYSSIFRNHYAYDLALYAQDEIKLIRPFALTLGLRYDYHQVDEKIHEDELSPKLGLVYRPLSITVIRASAGRGFRAATMAELFTDTIVSGFRVKPNLELKAERAWSYEVGINQIVSEHLIFDVALFHNDFWDMIEPKMVTTDSIQFQNLTRARIRGVEVSSKTRWWGRRIGADISYTYLDPKDLFLDQVLAYRPGHPCLFGFIPTSLLTLSLTFNYWIFGASLDYRYAARMEKVEAYTDDDRVPMKILDGRISVEMGTWTLSADVDNMLQYNYAPVERNLAPIRKYLLTLSCRF